MPDPARQVIQDWMRFFVESDVEAIVGLHAPSATFTGTSSRRFTTATEDIRAYFARVLRDRKPARADVLECCIQDFGEVAVATLLDHIRWADTASPRESMGRVTFVLRQRPEGWRIESFHRSEVPPS